jgi:hypothetical protein
MVAKKKGAFSQKASNILGNQMPNSLDDFMNDPLETPIKLNINDNKDVKHTAPSKAIKKDRKAVNTDIRTPVQKKETPENKEQPKVRTELKMQGDLDKRLRYYIFENPSETKTSVIETALSTYLKKEGF